MNRTDWEYFARRRAECLAQATRFRAGVIDADDPVSDTREAERLEHIAAIYGRILMSDPKNTTKVRNALARLEPDESGMYVISPDQRKRWMRWLREVDARDEQKEQKYLKRRRAKKVA